MVTLQDYVPVRSAVAEISIAAITLSSIPSQNAGLAGGSNVAFNLSQFH